MPSTYSSSLRLELQATGENANTWGTKTNNNLNLIEQAVAGYVKITLTSASATYTLDIADASASDGRNAFIEFVGTVASAISVVVPDVEKGYWVKNSATGSNLTFRTSSGTGFTLPTNQWVFAITDGASAVNTTPTSLTGYARLASDQTFTGLNTFTSTVNVQAALSVTGNVLVSGVTTLASAVDIKGATSLASTLVVGGAATFNSNVSVSGTFLVSGAATLASSVDIKGATSLASTLLVNGNAVFNSNVSVSGTFTVSGVANLLSAVNLRGATSVGSTLVVNGAATFNSTVSVSSTLAVGPGAVGTPSISTTGDTNTGIWFPAADILAVSTGGSERMRIDASGNVGIGATSPTFKLEVITNSAANVGLRVQNQSTSQYAGGGIIATGPSAATTQGGAGFYYYNTNAGGTQGALTITQTDYAGNYQKTLAEHNFNSEYWAFYTSNNERMRINSSGYVGIGTSSPSAEIELSRTSGQPTILVNSVQAAGYGPSFLALRRLGSGSTATPDNSGIGQIRFDGYDSTAAYALFAAIECQIGNNAAGGAPSLLAFYTSPSGASVSERMRIDSSGNVGIGTSGPGVKLDVAGDIRSTTGNYYAANGSVYGWGDLTTYVGGNASTDIINFITASSERMRIDSSGNVGIGTSSPAHKLDVNGNIALGSTIFSGTGVSTGDVSIELGANRTGSGASYIDFHSAASTDYDARFIRNSGANGFFTLLNTGTGTFTLQQAGSGAIAFQTNSVERMQITAAGNVQIGTAALATTATDGFLYIPTCAGTPTGTPTAITGLAPLVINSTNNKLYFYSGGAWRDAGP